MNKLNQNFNIGDYVLINKDERVFKNVLKDKWSEKFRKLIGQVCKVEGIGQNGELLLSLNDVEFLIPKELCYKINDTKSDENYSGFNNLEESTSKFFLLFLTSFQIF